MKFTCTFVVLSIVHVSNMNVVFCFSENIGCPVLFQWIERLKEILEEIERERERHTEYEENVDTTGTSCTISNTNIAPQNTFDLDVIHGIPVTDRKSTFQGHLCKVTSQHDIPLVKFCVSS